MAVQDDKTILNKGDLKAYHEAIAPMLGGTFMVSTNNSDYYSTDEKIVGVWTDGKPLYQKTFINTNPIPSDSWIDTDIVNGENAHLVGGYMFEDATGADVPHNIYYSTTLNTLVTVRADGSKIYCRIQGTSSSKQIFILQYTKTTDTAGSATTTPGAYDINFPNTWKENTEIYFGNGVYGYRATGTIASIAANDRADVIMVSGTANTAIVNSGGVVGTSNYEYSVPSTHEQGKREQFIWYNKALSSYPANSVIFYVGNWSSSALTNEDYDVWVTYTK